MADACATALVVGTICGIICNFLYYLLSGDKAFHAILGVILVGWLPATYFGHVMHEAAGQIYSGTWLLAFMISIFFAETVRDLFFRKKDSNRDDEDSRLK